MVVVAVMTARVVAKQRIEVVLVQVLVQVAVLVAQATAQVLMGAAGQHGRWGTGGGEGSARGGGGWGTEAAGMKNESEHLRLTQC